LKAIAEVSRHPVIASGGIASLQDVKQVASIRGVMGMLVGKALYSGALALDEATQEAVKASRERDAGGRDVS
jgi:phosphoribosylformimino-5-aminoimidazole carboxamide ribotide isomerase